MPNDLQLNFSQLSFNKYTQKPVVENKARNWVMNGRNNENYKYIIDRYNGSTTNKAVNNSYIDLAYGRGLSIHEKEDDSLEVKELHSYIHKNEVRAILTDNQIFTAHSFQIHRQKGNKNKLAKIEHISKSNVIPSIPDDNGVIKSYWYSMDWTKQYQAKYKPKEYPAFGYGELFGYELPEIYVGRPYQIGQEYFEIPDYAASLQYAKIEEELSNYYQSHIHNGLSFGSIVNVPNSSQWSQAEKNQFMQSSKDRLTGSTNANTQVYNFKSADTEDINITNVENNTAHKQWDFLVAEASAKILSGHKCISPALVGLGASRGFSSVADEMDMMEQQLMKRIIAPKQAYVIDSLIEVFDYFKLKFEGMYLRPLTEIEGEEEEKEKVDVEEKVAEDVALAKDCNCEKKKSELDAFIELGEDEDLENFDLIDENEVDYEEEHQLELASTGVARPNAKSTQDTDDFIVRYKYVGNKNPEREFCKKMMAAEKIYRKEDILQLTNKVVNDFYTNKEGRQVGWGPNGDLTYSIWLYKGGGGCKHKWNRVIYLKKGKSVDVNSPLAKIISTSEARRRGYKLITNDTKVSVEPRNMTNRGFLKAR